MPFQTDFMTTGISPLGLISFSRLPDAISQVVKTSVDNVPVNQMDAYRRNDAKEVASVFSEAISNAIITQLKSLLPQKNFRRFDNNYAGSAAYQSSSQNALVEMERGRNGGQNGF